MKTLLILFSSVVVVILLIFNIGNIMGLWIGHFTKGDKVYYRTWHSWKWFTFSTREVPEADAKSMKRLSWCFGKDKNHVFFENEIIPECDPKTVEVISKKSSYCRDTDAVFLCIEKISDDPDNFVILKRGWTKDSKRVYDNGKVFPLDAATFEFLDEEGLYAADKNKITFERQEIVGADRATFQILDKYYSQDKYRRYRYSKPVPGAITSPAQ